MVPNYEFWSSLLERVFEFIAGILTRIRSRGGYVSI